ncbi:hypothetical protein Zmor_018934 [Zophobas morio]|uniref:Gustatory receptor n=1 Tax=Zophobas morio TaxID=2755281 RepID=A0AA38MDM4_9CUCU|nr:hypothetical protein Zmor_018934 [Zophobas morio]
MIRTRYKNLRKMVQVHFERRRKIQLDALKRIQYIVRSLKVTVDGYNDLFGWTNLFNMCLSLARILNITQLLLFQLNRPQFLAVKVFNLIFITWILAGTVIMIVIMNSTLSEYHEMTKFCENAKYLLKITNLEGLKLRELTLLGHAYAQFFYNIWSEFYAEYLHTLMNFHNQFLSCLLVNMIRTRYKNLRKMVQVHFERRRKIQLDALKRVQYTVRSLKVTVDGYNDLFGWTNLFNICLSLARILNITQLLLFQLNRPQFLTVKVLNLIFITWILAGTVIMIVIMNSTLSEYHEMTKLCENGQYLKITDLEGLKLRECSKFFLQNAPEFRVANFFSIKRNFILSVALIFVNFEIALIQMANE